ncbi:MULTISPECIES: hypothetical protein [unclassified Mycoplasma]|uniref:hypothetical protein n=1 Tax=unclassified Mycoplasma TaxID=2683645 RepID=UPI00197C6E33|nr:MULTISPECIES: hypothetical protein [unclassified Mycoplasma]MBN4084422.1 hypothetical protein [Mycoplasma sp. CSL10166]MBU4692911.1 hypothetical protein [Mycoplasma sp. CSL7491-lung]
MKFNKKYFWILSGTTLALTSIIIGSALGTRSSKPKQEAKNIEQERKIQSNNNLKKNSSNQKNIESKKEQPNITNKTKNERVIENKIENKNNQEESQNTSTQAKFEMSNLEQKQPNRKDDLFDVEFKSYKIANKLGYPASIASFTNKSTGSIDKEFLLNDNNTTYNNRWSNWQNVKRSKKDWVGIIFGSDKTRKEEMIDRVEIIFGRDFQSDLPKTDWELQYYPINIDDSDLKSGWWHAEDWTGSKLLDDNNWKNVELIDNPSLTKFSDNQDKVVFDFKKVQAYAVRIKMNIKDDKKGIIINEFTAKRSK